MTIALARSSTATGTGGVTLVNGGGGGTAPAVGSVLIAYLCGGNAWTSLPSRFIKVAFDDSQADVAICIMLVKSGDGASYTFGVTGGASTCVGRLEEWSGFGAYRVDMVASDHAVGAETSHSLTTGLTTSQDAIELAVVAIGFNASKTVTFTAPSGWSAGSSNLLNGSRSLSTASQVTASTKNFNPTTATFASDTGTGMCAVVLRISALSVAGSMTPSGALAATAVTTGGDFNSNTPQLRGLEWRPTSRRSITLSGPTGVLQRFRPGGVTVSAIHRYLETVVGAPGLGIEVLDTVAPALATSTVFPGTDSGSVVTGWVDQAGGTANFGEIADTDLSDYHRNSGNIINALPLRLEFRGATASLSGKRISRVRLNVLVGVGWLNVGGFDLHHTLYGTWQGVYNIAGTDYLSSPVNVDCDDFAAATVISFDSARNPATGLPWTQADVNAIINGTDEFGVTVAPPPGYSFSAVDTGVRVYGMWLEILSCTENRRGFLYVAGTPDASWEKATLGATAACSAATWYFLHLFPLNPSSADYFSVPLLVAPDAIIATDPAATKGDQRVAGTTSLVDGGIIASQATAARGAMLPALIDVAGSIQSQSQPYVLHGLDAGDDARICAGASAGGQITGAGATTYGGVYLVAGWATSTKPDADLVIEIRHGSGSLTGGGTLDATGTIRAADASATLASHLVIFQAPFTSVNARQYVVYCKSNASIAKPWLVGILDTHSDLVTTTTTANVETASQGGQTDSWFDGTGTPLDRYDLAAALASAPTAPSGFVATPKDAQ